MKVKKKLIVLVAIMLLLIPMEAFAATKVTPSGQGNGYAPHEVKDLQVGEYEMDVKAGEQEILNVYTAVPAKVSIKEYPDVEAKITGPDNSYLARFSFRTTSSTITIVVAAHTHDWSKSDGECVICHEKCQHPETEISGYDKVYTTDESGVSHYVLNKCKVCGYIVKTKEKHDFSIVGKGKNGSHEVKCSKCNDHEFQKCTFKTEVSCKQQKKFEDKGKSHLVISKCDCGATNTVTKAHTFKKNKCTKCGLKKIVPGKITSVNAKQNTSVQKKTYKWKGHWSRGKYYPPHTTTYYVSDYTFSWKKPKDGYKYEVEYSPYVSSVVSGGKTVKLVSKTNVKFHLCLPSPSNVVTFKVTPISKSGIRGKTKTIKVKVD